MARESIHGLWIEKIGSGFVIEGYRMGAWDSDGTPGPIPFKGLADSPESLAEWVGNWIESWTPKKGEENPGA